MKKPEKSIALTISLLIFVIIFGIKILQHETFNTYGYDLGIRANIIWNIRHNLNVFDSLHQRHGFSGHFHPISFFLALFFYLWESPIMLLLLKCVALSFSFYLLYLISNSFFIPFLFFLNPYFFEILRFDFHPEVFSIPLIFLFFYFIEKKEVLKAVVGILFVLLFKEDGGVLVFSLGIYLLFKRFKKYGFFLILISIIYFILVVFLLLPHWSNNETLIQYHYPSLNPLRLFGNLFSTRKLISFLRFMLSFGFLPLLSLEFIPGVFLLFEHFSSSYIHQYNLTHQYSIYILAFSFFIFLKGFHKLERFKKILISSLIFFSSFNFMPNFFKEGISFKRKARIKEIIENIPKNSSVCANNNLIPHLCLRDSLSFFPDFRNYKYILVDMRGNLYPADYKKRFSYIDSLLKTKKYRIKEKTDSVFLLIKLNSG